MKTRGYVGYQIFPDRFYSSYKKEDTVDWDQPIEEKERGRHQLDFYGGDLKGIEEKIDYLKNLSVSFIYLTPIFQAVTNHRYDCTDFFSIDPILGTDDDLKTLADRLHEKGIRLVLDGVFNHIGMNHPWFTDEKYRDFINRIDGKVVYWGGHGGLPELNLNNGEVRDLLWNASDSAVRKWTELGVDDWRLDCAYDVGFEYLRELRHVLKSMGDHDTIGEVWSYPKKWADGEVLDAVMNYYFRELVKSFFEKRIDGKMVTTLINDTVNDCGLENILKCWNVMSSHDTPRVKNDFGKHWRLAVALQFTLPGSPVVYYGEELGLDAAGDPYCREPMPWERLNARNDDLIFYKMMIDLFNNTTAINSGYFGKLEYKADDIIAFSRYTEDIRDYRVIVINPNDEKRDFQLISKESCLMNCSRLIDELSGEKADIFCSTIYGAIEPNSFGVYRIDLNEGGYSPYKRL
ncbi:MAG TPA: glycoside hydrolase family 13 protein [Thermotogota bacterium]|nr:glycoside hydrolase family 13 protein [Thermotogota bacterium]HPJ88299.1 glycoside hydrolase family 13 protein [Thermotogota bacterium]HPR95354.1 glycoside hydrolase family 13 protein [Thermotogota bacterium]